MTVEDKKELDSVLQIVLPDDYYKEMRKTLIPYLIKWHEDKIKLKTAIKKIKLVCPKCKKGEENFTRNGNHIWCQNCDYEFNI